MAVGASRTYRDDRTTDVLVNEEDTEDAVLTHCEQKWASWNDKCNVLPPKLTKTTVRSPYLDLTGGGGPGAGDSTSMRPEFEDGEIAGHHACP